MNIPADEDLSAIRLANEQFYRALTNLDLGAMESVWAHDGAVRCIHPGWEIVEGWEAVQKTWDLIFRNTTSLIVEPTDVKVRVEGGMAWVCCLETITSREVDGGTTTARATNLFVRKDDQWKLVLHHASQIPTDRPDASGPGGTPDGPEEDGEPTVH